MPQAFDIVIVGGGAAGLMAACHASRGLRVAVVERLPSPGRKILATGGGRCNFTTALPEESIPPLFGRHGRFITPALRAFPPSAIREWFARHGIASVVEDGRFVFPASHRAADVLDALCDAARRNGAAIMADTSAEELLRDEGGAVCGVRTSRGVIHAPCVILAAGGHSMPNLGSNGSGLALASAAGHAIVPIVPSLVPLVAADEWAKALPGVSLEDALVRFEAPRTGEKPSRRHAIHEERGAVLFTHRGVSGPAVLDISGFVSEALAAQGVAGAPDSPIAITIRPIASRDAEAWRALFSKWRAANGGKAIRNLLAGEMPRAFAQALCAVAGVPDAPLAQTGKAALEQLVTLCGGMPLAISSTEGWDHSMATRGGVSLSEVDPATMRSRLVDGLSFAGEILDLDAPCGGFNLTWAFASAALAMNRIP